MTLFGMAGIQTEITCTLNSDHGVIAGTHQQPCAGPGLEDDGTGASHGGLVRAAHVAPSSHSLIMSMCPTDSRFCCKSEKMAVKGALDKRCKERCTSAIGAFGFYLAFCKPLPGQEERKMASTTSAASSAAASGKARIEG